MLDVPPFLQGIQFLCFLFAFLHTITSLKRYLIRKKRIINFFPFKVDNFHKGDKTFVRVASFKMYSLNLLFFLNPQKRDDSMVLLLRTDVLKTCFRIKLDWF